ncbi:sigma-70 family RNA polymerase sigma factor [Rhizobium sullae]|nr:sigma-70 family RNA polymerase sigma factor [Rhizobium sullae]
MPNPANDPANDNTRPASFDQRLIDHLPYIQKIASLCVRGADEREELVADSITYVLGSWQNFRPDGSFHKWLGYMVRGIATEKKRRFYRRAKHMRQVEGEMALENAATLPNQFHAVELAEAISNMPAGRDGEVVMRRAMGDTLTEVGVHFGVGRERARQIEERGLATLRRRVRRATDA